MGGEMSHIPKLLLKAKTIKSLEENKRKNIHNPKIAKNTLYKTQNINKKANNPIQYE